MYSESLKIAELEAEIETLTLTLESEKKRLQEIIGTWRRLSQEKKPKRECVSEGWTGDYGGYHYKSYVVQDIPTDLDIQSVVEELKKSFLPSVKPYRLRKVDYSSRYNGWVVEVTDRLQINLDHEF